VKGPRRVSIRADVGRGETLVISMRENAAGERERRRKLPLLNYPLIKDREVKQANLSAKRRQRDRKREVNADLQPGCSNTEMQLGCSNDFGINMLFPVYIFFSSLIPFLLLLTAARLFQVCDRQICAVR